MRRREFIAGLGTIAASQRAASAQQGKLPVVGFLNSASSEGYAPEVAAFRDGLGEMGFSEGRNILVDYRWARGNYERLPALAAELVRRSVAVIAATTTPAAVVAKAATVTIPIVFTTSGDPVELGLVASLNRPGGNVTGATQMGVEVAAKRLEILHEILPSRRTFALLVNRTGPNAEAVTRLTLETAHALGIEVHILAAATEREINEAFDEAVRLRVDGMVIGTDPFFNTRSAQFAALTVEHKLPTIYQYREFVASGGLAAYSGSVIDSYHTAGVLTGRILRGEKASDLPVQQSTRIELILNLKTAQALGLTVPSLLLARADEVIE